MDASKYLMPFGKYKGQTLDQIASSDEGLRYLDWASGAFDPGSVHDMIVMYLRTDSVARELELLLGEQ